jgi:Bacterial toxin YdaS
MDKDLELHIENVRALAGSALGTLQAMDDELKAVIKAAGGIRPLARELGMSPQALSEWKRIPAHRIRQVEAVTKIPREKLRPDLYRR